MACKSNGKRGRSLTFPDAAIQFCLSIKSLFGQPLQQALGMVESLLRLAKLDWPVPDFSTVCQRQKSLQEQLSYQPSKHGAQYRRELHKVHLGIDAQTLAIRAIEVTTNAICDAPMLPQLLAQIPADEPIASVCPHEVA